LRVFLRFNASAMFEALATMILWRPTPVFDCILVGTRDSKMACQTVS